MVLPEIIDRLKASKDALRAKGVEHLAVFGSRARGDGCAASDLDLLLDVPHGSRFSLLDLIGVEHLVSDLTGLSANAFMQRSIDTAFQAEVRADQVEIF